MQAWRCLLLCPADACHGWLCQGQQARNLTLRLTRTAGQAAAEQGDIQELQARGDRQQHSQQQQQHCAGCGSYQLINPPQHAVEG
jgi:hypothetical protein